MLFKLLQSNAVLSIIEKLACGCISAATMKTPATKQKNTVVTEQNCDSTPSFINPIRTTIITRLYIVEIIPASISLNYIIGIWSE